jgi:hypothetical protein
MRFVRVQMRHEHNFEIDRACIAKTYAELYPEWIVTLAWLSVFLFGGVFWWGVIMILVR